MTRTRKNIARIVDILKKDRWSSCRLIAEWMGIRETIVQQILRHNLQKKKLHAVCAARSDNRTERTVP